MDMSFDYGRTTAGLEHSVRPAGQAPKRLCVTIQANGSAMTLSTIIDQVNAALQLRSFSGGDAW